MTVDYNDFAKTFSNSRKDMKWEEIEYFLSFLDGKKELKILDIGCGNGRLFGELQKKKIDIKKYLGIDLSKILLDEAREIYSPSYQHSPLLGEGVNTKENKINFLELNMLDISKIEKFTGIKKFDYIFLIASFHHLNELKERKKVMKNLEKILKNDGKIFMTNWALNSKLNEEKYKDSIINHSKNNFGSLDYKIKIGKFDRFYHCFSLEELEFLAKNVGFKVIENRVFDNERNFISIFEK